MLPGYVAQFGIPGDPAVGRAWLCPTCHRLDDEPRLASNSKLTLSFASGGKDTRQTQIFINLSDNGGFPNFLDGQGFVPFGRVVQGADIVKSLHDGYGLVEAVSGGLAGGVSQSKAVYYGNEFLDAVYPKLSKIVRVTPII